jgi:hypothetical protein
MFASFPGQVVPGPSSGSVCVNRGEGTSGQTHYGRSSRHFAEPRAG